MISANSAQLKKFHKDGYLILENFFSTDELDPVKSWIALLVDNLSTKLYKEGLIPDLFENESFETRLIKVSNFYPDAPLLIHSQGEFDQNLLNLWTSEKLNNLVKSFFPSQPALHPVWNIRAKTPCHSLSTVPWHQDAAYLSKNSDQVFQLSAWIPFIDVSAEHGPLCFISGCQSDDPVLRHELENQTGNPRSWYLKIPSELLPKGRVIRCEVPKGSIILFHQKTVHCCEENFSDQVRWTIDLRWQLNHQPNGLDHLKDCLPCHKCPLDISDPAVYQWANNQRLAPDESPENNIHGPWMTRWQ